MSGVVDNDAAKPLTPMGSDAAPQTNWDAEQQADELQALRAIYGDALATPTNNSITLSLPLELDAPVRVELPGGATAATLPTLPPFSLTAAFPPHYPSISPPRLRLFAEYAPLPLLSELADLLSTRFVPGEPAIFEFAREAVDFLAERVVEREDAGYVLRLTDDEPGARVCDDRRVARPRATPRDVAARLQLHADRAEYLRVAAGWFKCPACWERKPGKRCMSLSACRHVACTECLSAFWTARIEEGRVLPADIVCIESECAAAAHVNEVRRAVDTGTYDKYERFLLNRALEGDADFVQCPRPGCQQTASSDPEDASLGRCAYCGFVFCVGCSKAWHAPADCAGEDETEEELPEMIEQFGEADDEAREDMKERLPQATWERIQLGWELCRMGGKRCPQCGTVVIKNGGCAHMRCVCGCDFCWHCQTNLNEVMQHYNPVAGCRMYEEDEQQQIHEQIWDWVFYGE